MGVLEFNAARRATGGKVQLDLMGKLRQRMRDALVNGAEEGVEALIAEHAARLKWVLHNLAADGAAAEREAWFGELERVQEEIRELEQIIGAQLSLLGNDLRRARELRGMLASYGPRTQAVEPRPAGVVA